MSEDLEYYYDGDGNPTDLEKLCRTEPVWAANTIRRYRAQLADLNNNLDQSLMEIRDLDEKLAECERERDGQTEPSR